MRRSHHGVPTWLLTVAGRIRAGRIIGYLLTIALFYWVVGVLLLSGFTALGDTISAAGDSDVVLWIQLAVGVGLFAWSFRFGRDRGPGDGPGEARPLAAAGGQW